MKITVDKYEYAKIIRACYAAVDDLCSGCRKCVLKDVCDGADGLLDYIEIEEEHKP